MYTLTLTHEERKALDFVGHRYEHGDDFIKLLTRADVEEMFSWNMPIDITFHIQEYLAWEMKDLLCESQYDLLADPLANKLTNFIESII